MDTHFVEGGSVTGYSEARVERTVAICAQGAAHGAWKDAMRRVEEGREARSCCHSSTDEISESVDIFSLHNILWTRFEYGLDIGTGDANVCNTGRWLRMVCQTDGGDSR